MLNFSGYKIKLNNSQEILRVAARINVRYFLKNCA